MTRKHSILDTIYMGVGLFIAMILGLNILTWGGFFIAIAVMVVSAYLGRFIFR